MTNDQAVELLKPGVKVLYTPFEQAKQWFAGVVDQEPRMLGSTMVVRLKEMERAYGKATSKEGDGVAAASVSHVRLREP